jgi:hypothetical protein
MRELKYISISFTENCDEYCVIVHFAANNQECFGCIFNVKRYIMIRSAFTGTCLCESN